MYSFMRYFELHQMRINATNGAECIGKLRKIYNGNGNFDLYHVRGGKDCRSIAKPGSGCRSTCYGDIFYIKCQLRGGDLDPHRLTKYGRKLIENYKTRVF